MVADEPSIGSVGFCEMVYRSNLFAMVSGGTRPKYAENSVLLYDDMSKKSVLEFTFNQPVLGVRCKRDRLVAILKNRIHVFSYPSNPEKLMTIPTRENPLGLCEVSTGTSTQNLLVFPGFKIGSLQLVVSQRLHVQLVNQATTNFLTHISTLVPLTTTRI